ncbi:MAG: Hpt domain-containing protein [Parvibaculum sp.]
MGSVEKAMDFEAMVAQAEAAVAALSASYREQLVADVETLTEIWASLEQGAPVDGVMSQLQSLAHNIKGQGGSFGYDLVTSVGASLCDYIRSGERKSIDEMNIVHAHIKILKMIAENDISGTGGDTGARILAKLATLTK